MVLFIYLMNSIFMCYLSSLTLIVLSCHYKESLQSKLMSLLLQEQMFLIWKRNAKHVQSILLAFFSSSSLSGVWFPWFLFFSSPMHLVPNWYPYLSICNPDLMRGLSNEEIICVELSLTWSSVQLGMFWVRSIIATAAMIPCGCEDISVTPLHLVIKLWFVGGWDLAHITATGVLVVGWKWSLAQQNILFKIFVY